MSTRPAARVEIARGDVVLGTRLVPYRVIRSRRARCVHLRMLAHASVEIVVPERTALPAAPEVLQSRERWILRQLERMDALPRTGADSVEFMGAEYRLVLTRRGGRTGSVSIAGGEMRVEAGTTQQVTALARTFLRRQARTVLVARAQHWAERIGVQFGRISVRDQRTRWGSCSREGNLSFSWRLVMAPLPVLDYVVIHELMHRHEMNHSRRFWDGLARHCPEYRQHRSWLNEHGYRLTRALCPADEAER